MPVPTLITDLSATAGSNFPAGSDAPSNLDNVQRAHGAFIRSIYDNAGNGWISPYAALAGATFTGAVTGITNLSITGNFTVAGNTALGDAAADTLSVSGSVIKTAAGAWTLPAPSAGVGLTVNGSGAARALYADAGANTEVAAFNSSGTVAYAALYRGGVRKAYLSADSVSGLLLVNEENTSTALYTNNLQRIVIVAAGNVQINAPASSTALTVTAVAGALAASFSAGPVKMQVTTVAALLAAATAGAGAVAFVTDANATTFASIVAAGGANGVPVYSDGTNWRIG